LLHHFFKNNDIWTYIYNFIYYFVFGFIIVSIKDYKHFAIVVLGAISMMTGLSFIWYLFPNTVETRVIPKNYFLKKTQLIDNNNNNACPSAHVVFAMYAFYLLRNVIGYIPAVLIPIIISISCCITTQHVLIDVFMGILYAVLFYNLILKKISPDNFK
jgi:membrane-associated phospholipid phosphatase